MISDSGGFVLVIAEGVLVFCPLSFYLGRTVLRAENDMTLKNYVQWFGVVAAGFVFGWLFWPDKFWILVGVFGTTLPLF